MTASLLMNLLFPKKIKKTLVAIWLIITTETVETRMREEKKRDDRVNLGDRKTKKF